MANIPPVPINQPITDASGIVSQPWLAWFRQVLSRVGGNSGTSIPDISGTVTSLQMTVAGIQTQVSNLSGAASGFNVGPNL